MPEPNLTTRSHTPSGSPPGRGPWHSYRRLFRILWLWRDKGAHHVLKRVLLWLGLGTRDYESWIKANDTLSPQDVAQIRERIKQFQQPPLFSLVLVIEKASVVALRRVVDCVRAQLYEKWELCIVGQSSAAQDVKALLRAYADTDARIKLVAGDAGDMAQAGNAGIAVALGNFIGFLGQGDQLAPHALYMIAEMVNACPDANIIYTDEDVIDDLGRRTAPQFKTDWNPDLFLSQWYLGCLTVYRRDLIAPTGFCSGFAGSAEYDLALRVVERVAPATIKHIPYVLAHRNLPGPEAANAPEAVQGARRALQDHLDRLGISASVEASRSGDCHRVRWPLPAVQPKVSIIIPTRDLGDFLRGAIDSILARTNYHDYEIVIVDNQSVDPDTLSYLAGLAGHPQIRVLRFDHPFNYSAINNFAARQCQSPVLVFLNNDILIINEDWLTEMVSHGVRPQVGAVGAMLYYPNDVIQHGGVIVGLSGVAANCYNGLERGAAGYFHRAELIQNYSAVTAACLLTRADVFNSVGGFNDNDLPVAFNDVDYCLRLRERGYFVTWTPYAELYHLESVSRGDDISLSKIARFRRDQSYMTEHWSGLLSSDPYYSPNLSLDEAPFALTAQPRLRQPWKVD